MAQSAQQKTPADVKKLAEDMDEKLNKFVDDLPRSTYKGGFTEDNWEEELEKIPLFMTKLPENLEDAPDVEALQQIKYASEESTREDDALTHKEDGNHWFQKKLYKQAIRSYTEGLQKKCADLDINAVLYTNRAAANFHLGNHRSALNDAKEALNLKPTHLKALYRAVECCLKLEDYGEAVQWCDKGLQSYPNDKKILDFRVQASKFKKAGDKERRKKQLEEKKRRAAEEKLVSALKARKIRFVSEPAVDEDEEDQTKAFVTNLVSNEPSGRTMVALDDEGKLHWPVRFLYPEHGHSDLISAFDENSRFLDHLEVMFSTADEPPLWDPERLYRVGVIRVYFEDYDEGKLVEVTPDQTLKLALQDPRYKIVGGVPTYFILSTSTPYHEHFLKKYIK